MCVCLLDSALPAEPFHLRTENLVALKMWFSNFQTSRCHVMTSLDLMAWHHLVSLGKKGTTREGPQRSGIFLHLLSAILLLLLLQLSTWKIYLYYHHDQDLHFLLCATCTAQNIYFTLWLIYLTLQYSLFIHQIRFYTNLLQSWV